MTERDNSEGLNPSPPSRMRGNVPIPRPLSLEGDMKENWGVFFELWENYEIITGLENENDRYRIAHFLTAIGPEAVRIHNGLPFRNPEEKKDFKIILKLWKEYCVGRTNLTYERYKFNTCAQGRGEGMEQFYVRLRSLASSCEFDKLADDFIKDRIVVGIIDDTVRKRLLQEQNLTLQLCLDICRAHEASMAQSQAMAGESVARVHVDKYRSKPQQSSNKHDKQWSQQKSDMIECKFCGRSHVRQKEKCPAYGKSCNKCHEKNHFANRCKLVNVSTRSNKPNKGKRNRDSVKALHSSTNVDTDSDESVMAVDTGNGPYKKKIMGKFLIKGRKIEMQVDCGATVNILPKKHVPHNVEIVQSPRKLSLYGSDASIEAEGHCRVWIKNPKTHKKYNVEFVVVDKDCVPLIGAQTAQYMKLIKVKYENIAVVQSSVGQCNQSQNVKDSSGQSQSVNTKSEVLESYGDVFKGLGKMPGTVHLQTDSSVEPVVMPPRRVPIAVKEKLKKELDRLQGIGVIEPVSEPTDWVSGLVAVEKPNGKVRVCIDPQYLNRALKRGHYPLPVIDDVLPMLNNVKVFTKADCKEGFLQCELDQESSYLTTFQTPWGRFRWCRMPFGISPAPEIFQCHLDQNLEGLPGMYKIADDILIVGRGDTLEEANADHDKNLRMFLDRCRERGIKLNPDKLEFKRAEVRFMGHIISRDGLKVDPRKVAAIAEMPVPDSVESLQRFIGMIKYLARYLPSLSDMTEPLRRLTHKNSTWQWGTEQQDAFIAIKQQVCDAPVLKYFDPACPTEGQGDASQAGLGFALLQNGQPVAYASRALTEAEKRYSQIEKELLAQVFGLERHHEFVYGREITLWTDHKPLVAIMNKPLANAPKRLQRLLLRLNRYTVKIKYMPGPELYLADTLSRAYLNDVQRSQTETEIESIHLIDGLRISEATRHEIQQKTAEDSTLQSVMQYIREGWPSSIRECPMETRPYYSIRHEMTMDDGIVFKGLRCVIPRALRETIRNKLHAAHTGIESTLKRARECVYWPSMSAELKDYISKCEICNENPSRQQKETLHPHDVPNRPWEKLGCDIFEVDGRSYLCTVDYFSDFFEIDNLHGKKDAPAVIIRLKRHFATHGIPDILQSDNGPPFNSKEFADFAKAYGFALTKSSPEFPQSNGKVEAAVKIAKRLVKRSTRDHGDFYLSLLVWRNTPTASMDSSPAQRLLGRRTKNNVPIAAELLEPKVLKDIKKRKEANQKRQEKYYNRDAKNLEPLRKGDVVRIQPRRKNVTWEKAKVIEKVAHRSYIVETESGVQRRRNRRHLRKTAEACEPNFATLSFPSHQQRPKNNESETSVSQETHEPPVQPCRRSVRNRKSPAYLKDYMCQK